MALQGSMPVIGDELGGMEVRALVRAFPFQLGIMDAGEIKAPEELEPGHPSWFSAPRFAKAAGAALVARHPGVRGYDVLKVDANGHWRTVHTEWVEA